MVAEYGEGRPRLFRERLKAEKPKVAAMNKAAPTYFLN